MCFVLPTFCLGLSREMTLRNLLAKKVYLDDIYIHIGNCGPSHNFPMHNTGTLFFGGNPIFTTTTSFFANFSQTQAFAYNQPSRERAFSLRGGIRALSPSSSLSKNVSLSSSAYPDTHQL